MIGKWLLLLSGSLDYQALSLNRKSQCSSTIYPIPNSQQATSKWYSLLNKHSIQTSLDICIRDSKHPNCSEQHLGDRLPYSSTYRSLLQSIPSFALLALEMQFLIDMMGYKYDKETADSTQHQVATALPRNDPLNSYERRIRRQSLSVCTAILLSHYS